MGIIAEGKTKIIRTTDDHQLDLVSIESKDDITAGDGVKHDVVPGKGALANATTCNVFEFLNRCGVKTAFECRFGDTEFLGRLCAMIPLEVVVRRRALGSFCKRQPHVLRLQYFPRLVTELFLKTKDQKFGDFSVPKDDPLLQCSADGSVELFVPHEPATEPFVKLPYDFVIPNMCKQMRIDPRAIVNTAAFAFLLLEKTWASLGVELIDCKFEYGIGGVRNELLLADVVDNDSWRILRNGKHLDKQLYRDGRPIAEVTAAYREVAALTSRFSLPKQTLVIWKASQSDEFPFGDAQRAELRRAGVDVKEITLSAHKETMRAVQTASALDAILGDKIIIAFVGLSNGLGPILAANTSVPVISVPAGPDPLIDVLSSLRMPSDVPNATVMNPANALAFARSTLAQRNPVLYALDRMRLEERQVNLVPIDPRNANS